MNPATTVGRYQLSTRFTAIVNVAFVPAPEREQLLHVYRNYLTVLSNATNHFIWVVVVPI